jgi:uncharacterized GH25 family protein
MKHTAMDWLFSKLSDIERDKFEWQIILKEAKEMEKEQIINAYDQGICEGFDYGYHNDNPKEESGEEYYKETYEKK